MKESLPIELILATEKSLESFGNIVNSFDEEKVKKRPWPAEGWRKFRPGTDIIPNEDVNELHYKWTNVGLTMRKNEGHLSKIGFLATTECSTERPQDFDVKNICQVLVREMTYHPDCGEVFYPKDGGPFIALLAPPGDDFDPAKVQAFYFDGSFGFQCDPMVWHQGMYTFSENCIFQGKQGPLHACVTVDIVEEFGHYVRVPLMKLPNYTR